MMTYSPLNDRRSAHSPLDGRRLRPAAVRRLLPGVFLALLLMVTLRGRPAAAGPVPAGLTASDWAQIAALLPPAVPIQQAYLKASNVQAGDTFGGIVAVDGDTVVVGALGEDSNGTGEGDNSASSAGAAYVFVRSGTTWSQQAYLKASNAGANDFFGSSVAVDGDTVIVSAPGEDSNGTGEGDNSASGAGAAYVFVRSGTTWSQQAYLKASNAGAGDNFGRSVAIDGDTAVVSAQLEDSNGTSQGDNSASGAGAAYVFVRSGTTWSQQAYLKASNVGEGDAFGNTIDISGDTVVVDAPLEDSNGTSQGNNSAADAGAAYVFVRSGTTWSQQAYLKASNVGASDNFGNVAIDGDTIVVGAYLEDSNGTSQGDNSANGAGAAYIFVRSGTTWSQQAYLKASNVEINDQFGNAVAIAGDTVIVGAWLEDSNGTSQGDNTALLAGAAYVFTRSGTTWSQQAYLKASNVEAGDNFGNAVAIAGDTVIVGARAEDSNGTSQGNNDDANAGAAYVFHEPPTTGTIVIVKDADPADDTPFSFSENITSGGGTFTLIDPSGDTETFSTVAPGTYTIIEDGETGWTLDDITCVDPSNNTTEDESGGTAVINLSAGETVTCTFSNSRDTGTITIVKDATPADNTTFSFTEDIPGAGSGFTLSDPSDTTETFSNVPTGSYQVTETAEPGWTLDNITCVDPDNGSSTDSPTATIDLDDDETVTCTFDNSLDTGTIRIVKQATPADDTSFLFNDDIGPAAFNLSDPSNPERVYNNVPVGSYYVQEGPLPGWTLDSVTCVDPTNDSSGDVPTSRANIELADGETVTCTFANSQLPPPLADIFASATTAGTTGNGLAFGPHDILMWTDSGGWSKWFDGTAARLMPNGKAMHNINAFWIPDPNGDDVLISFTQNARFVPGISGKVDGMDLVWWDGTSWSLVFDGQDVGLTVLTKEKIDALHVLDDSAAPPALLAAAGGSCLRYLLLSTAGDGQVPNYSGGVIKFDGTDVLGFCQTAEGTTTTGMWIRILNGKAEGLRGQALVNLSASDDGLVLYLTTRMAINVDGAVGGHSMVYRYDFATGEFSGPYWSAPAEGMPRPVDGLQVEGELPTP